MAIMFNVEYIIPNIEPDTLGYAHVTAEVAYTHPSPDDFKKMLVRAIMHWIEDSIEGKQAYLHAMKKPDLQDLALALSKYKLLHEYLNEVGIYHLKVVNYNTDRKFTWRMSDALIDTKKFKQKSEYKKKKKKSNYRNV